MLFSNIRLSVQRSADFLKVKVLIKTKLIGVDSISKTYSSLCFEGKALDQIFKLRLGS